MLSRPWKPHARILAVLLVKIVDAAISTPRTNNPIITTYRG